MRNLDKRALGNFGARSGAMNLKATGQQIQESAKQSRSFLKGQLTATRVLIPANEVETQTQSHPFNPRNQQALDVDAVRDILPSIEEHGVNVEGLAVFDQQTKQYLLLDASRRRFCCIQAKMDLPLWVIEGEISTQQILALIHDSQEVKRWSYPEHGHYLVKILSREGLDYQTLNIEECATYLGIGRESLRKRLEAFELPLSMRKVFVDYEGIPNSYYGQLAKLKRSLIKQAPKSLTEIDGFIDSKMQTFATQLQVDRSQEIEVQQKSTLEQLVNFVAEQGSTKTKAASWQISELISSDNHRVYARKKQSADGRLVKYEFSRLSAQKLKQLDEMIQHVLTENDNC